MMQNKDELLEVVIGIIKQNLDSTQEISPDEQLLESGLIDSLSILQIYLAIQSETGADLDVGDITEETFATAQTITNLVDSRLST